MKIGFGLVLSVIVCGAAYDAHAGLFVKDCNDFNRDPIPMLDKLLATDPRTGQASDSDAATYKGETADGIGCTVEIERFGGLPNCNPSARRYTVTVRTDASDGNRKLCSAKLEFDADLDKSTSERLEYKSTYAYPRVFSSEFERLTVRKDGGGDHEFACHSFAKHKEGYRVGHEYRNGCRVKYRPADAVREISHSLGEATQGAAGPGQGAKVSTKPSKAGTPAPADGGAAPESVAAPAQ